MRKGYAVLTLIVFALSYVIELVLEHQHRVDSIGWWYTAIVAAVYTAVITGIVLIGRLIIRALRDQRRRNLDHET